MKIRNEIETIVKDPSREDVEPVVIESTNIAREIRITIANHSVVIDAEEAMQAIDNATSIGRVS